MMKNFIASAAIFIVIMFCGLNYAEDLPTTSEAPPVKNEEQTTKTKRPSIKSEAPITKMERPPVKSEAPITKMERPPVKSEGPITGKRRLGTPVGYSDKRVGEKTTIEYTDERVGEKTTKGMTSYEEVKGQKSGVVEEKTPNRRPALLPGLELQGAEFGFPRQDNTENQ